jgi:ABC-type lipoprotein release transport system permease subunit
MALPYELLIGLRYTRAKKHNHFISFISLISMLGIALGVAALIVVLSVMNGFQTELRSRILAVVSHVQITGSSGEMVGLASLLPSRRPDIPRSSLPAPFVQAQAMLYVRAGGARCDGARHSSRPGRPGRRFPPAHEERQARRPALRTASTSSSAASWRARSTSS